MLRSPRFTVRTAAALALAVGVCALPAGVAPASAEAVAASSSQSNSQSVEVGITKPADQKPRELRFKTPGIVKTVSVKEGDVIKADQELMAQDDTEEQNDLEMLKLDASQFRVDAAVVNAQAKKAEFDRQQKLKDQQNGSESDYERAQAEWKLSEIQISQEKQDLLGKQAKVKKQEGIIERMKLRSPMNGIVQSVDAHPGEMVDPNKPPVITIVNNDPLIVEVNLPTSVSLRLKTDQPMRVSYDRKDWKDAKVSFLAPMADAASGLQTVHLTLANPEGKASGLQIWVELPAPLAAAR
jgi:RND family efflux transporter MFP subunit